MISTEDSNDRARRRRSPLIAAAAAAVVVLIAGGGVFLATAGAEERGAAAKTTDARNGDSRTTEQESGRSGVAPGEPDPAGGVFYRLDGEPPAGPERAAVHPVMDTVSAEEVSRLARALGMSGTPRSSGGSWTLGSTVDGAGSVLRVESAAPGGWTFEALGPRGDDCRKGRECPDASELIAPGEPVGEEVARSAAAPVLKAVGQSGAELRTDRTVGGVRVVNADPVVGGLPTHGWSTDLQIGAEGRVVQGSGQLSKPAKGAEQPVLSADAALERLNSGARSSLGTNACDLPLEGSEQKSEKPPLKQEGGVPCSGEASPREVREVEVAEAVFGLSLSYADGSPSLVPSWLFRAEPGGGVDPYTVAQPAIEEASAEPPAEAPVPAEGNAILSYTVDGRSLTVTFWGGVCSDYRAEARESADAVRVRVVETPPPAGEVCTAQAKKLSETVRLEAPLGARKVLDAGSGEAIARATG